jgi:Flp pilus assembly protein TadG
VLVRFGHHHGSAARRAAAPGRESGYVLVLGSALMIGMLLFSSLVVDVGSVYAERRRDQSAADAGASAAAQDLRSSPATAAAAAIDYAERGLGKDLSDAAWNSCTTDTGALPVRAASFNCVSYNTTRSRVRVRVPDQYTDTAFADVIGIDRMRHSAFAVAGITQRGFGGVLPFGMPAGGGAGEGYACIKSNSGGQSQAPCNGPDSGNFGTIDITFFGSEDHGTTKSCGSGDARTLRIPNNIAVGSDHELGIYTNVETIDSNSCASNLPLPTAARTETGNLSAAVEAGLLSGTSFSDGSPARLQRRDPGLLAGAGRTRSIRGNSVDDNGLWTFIPESLNSNSGSGGDVPASCERDQFVDSSGNPTTANLPARVSAHVRNLSVADRMLALLTRCFSHYSGNAWGGGASAGMPALSPAEPRDGCATMPAPCTDPVFGLNTSTTDSPDLYDIQLTPRFAYVPELTGSFPSGSSSAVRFRAFRPVYIQRLTLGTGSGATNFDPGVGTSALNPSGNGVREVTLWVFPEDMLPGRLQESGAAYAVGVNRFVQLLR